MYCVLLVGVKNKIVKNSKIVMLNNFSLLTFFFFLFHWFECALCLLDMF